MTESRSLRLAVIACCLGAVVYAAAHPSPWTFNVPDWRFSAPIVPPLQEPGQAMQPAGTLNNHPSMVGQYILLGFAIVVGAVIAFFVGRAIYRFVKPLLLLRFEKVPPTTKFPVGASVPGEPLTPEQVIDAVTMALTRLDSAATSSDAVIAAWLALEDAALRHGIARPPASTSTEFTTDLLNRSLVPEADTIALRTVYLRTRFSRIPATSTDVDDARGWLRHIAATLEGVTV